MKILIMGLPGAGKTTLAEKLASLIGAVHWNADRVRQHINKDLGFSIDDRIEQAKRMGWLCDNVINAGYSAIADFVCPLKETRLAFGNAFIIYMDTIKSSRYENTNKLFVPPVYGEYNLKFTEYDAKNQAILIADYLRLNKDKHDI